MNNTHTHIHTQVVKQKFDTVGAPIIEIDPDKSNSSAISKALNLLTRKPTQDQVCVCICICMYMWV